MAEQGNVSEMFQYPERAVQSCSDVPKPRMSSEHPSQGGRIAEARLKLTEELYRLPL